MGRSPYFARRTEAGPLFDDRPGVLVARRGKGRRRGWQGWGIIYYGTEFGRRFATGAATAGSATTAGFGTVF